MVWTRKDSDAYRRSYPDLTFGEVRDIQDKVICEYHQLSDAPFTLLEFLLPRKIHGLKVLELGGYDGFHALAILTHYPDYTWTNVDISPIARERMRPPLADLPYRCEILPDYFWNWPLNDRYDLFYSSKTLEHMSIERVLKTLDHAQDIPYHIHIIDLFRNTDTHILDRGAMKTIKEWYLCHGFNANFGEYYGNRRLLQLRVMACKRDVNA